MQIKNKLIFLVLITGFILFYFFNGNDTSYTFRNAEYLKNHYNKHGLEMGFESEEEYEVCEKEEEAKPTENVEEKEVVEEQPVEETEEKKED